MSDVSIAADDAECLGHNSDAERPCRRPLPLSSRCGKRRRSADCERCSIARFSAEFGRSTYDDLGAASLISFKKRALEGYSVDIVVFFTRCGAPNTADCPRQHASVAEITLVKEREVALVEGAVVAFSGVIGWVGLIRPHAARVLVGAASTSDA